MLEMKKQRKNKTLFPFLFWFIFCYYTVVARIIIIIILVNTKSINKNYKIIRSLNERQEKQEL